jgi:hypothetical protein
VLHCVNTWPNARRAPVRRSACSRRSGRRDCRPAASNRIPSVAQIGNTLKMLMSSLKFGKPRTSPSRLGALPNWSGPGSPRRPVEVDVAERIEVAEVGLAPAARLVRPLLGVEEQAAEIVVHRDERRTAALVAQNARQVPAAQEPAGRAGLRPGTCPAEAGPAARAACRRRSAATGAGRRGSGCRRCGRRCPGPSRRRCSSAARRCTRRAPAGRARSDARAPSPARGTGCARWARRAS